MANRLAPVDLTAKTVHWFVHNIWEKLYWKRTSQSVDKEKFVKVQDQESEPGGKEGGDEMNGVGAEEGEGNE